MGGTQLSSSADLQVQIDEIKYTQPILDSDTDSDRSGSSRSSRPLARGKERPSDPRDFFFY